MLPGHCDLTDTATGEWSGRVTAQLSWEDLSRLYGAVTKSGCIFNTDCEKGKIINLSSYLEVFFFSFFFFQKPTLKWQLVILNSACIGDMSYGKKWSTEQSGWKQWGISALVWRKRFVEEKTITTPLYSHSDGRGQPLLVSMVCVSKERSWCRKGWEPPSESFSNLKGMIEIQKWFKNCPHISIYSRFGDSSRGMLCGGRTWRAQLSFPLVHLQGGKLRIPCRRGEARAEGKRGIETNRGLRFSEEKEGCGEERFFHL